MKINNNSFQVSAETAAQTNNELPPAVFEELDFAIEQVGKFAQAQCANKREFEKEVAPCMWMGQCNVAVASVGGY